MTIHPDDVSRLTQSILSPFFHNRTLMYSMYLDLLMAGRIEDLDTSWKELDSAETGDIIGMVENVVMQHVYDHLAAFDGEKS